MKILHLAESAKGGVGSYLSNISPLQCEAFGADKVHFVAPQQHRDQLADVSDRNLTLFDRQGRSTASIAAFLRAVRTTCDTFRPDVIHAHSTFAGLVIRAIYAQRRDRPVIVYCPHGWAFNIEGSAVRRRVLELVERGLSRWCDTIIAISRFEEKEARRIGIAASRVLVVLNGVPEAPEGVTAATWLDRRLKVLFVGRLDPQKGIDVLLEAIAPLHDRVSLRVAGASIASEEVFDLPEGVESLGWLDRKGICEQLAAADVVAMPSRWEGFGLVALEAMRAGKPVVASAVGGLPEIVEPGVTGWLVPSGSSLALREALAGTSLSECAAMGQAGRRRYLDRFTADRMNQSLMNEYRRLHRINDLRGRHRARSEVLAVKAMQGSRPMRLAP